MCQTFHKEEYVVYAGTGICVIDDIRTLSLPNPGNDRLYYVLRPLSNPHSTLYIPCDNDTLVSKMRYVLTKAEIDRLLLDIKDRKMVWIEDKNARSDYFHKILSAGNQQELLLLVGSIYLKKQERASAGKKLPFSDENILKTTERLVSEEFAFSLQIPVEKVNHYIQEKLGICSEEA